MMVRWSSAGIILWASFLIKTILAVFLPVFGDESYYWFWGKHPQLSYFDHPGMVGWLTWLGAKVSFLPASLMVRWPFLILSTVSFYIFLQILNILTKDKQSILWLTFFYLANPLLGLGGIFTTPDVPLAFFWSLSFLLTLKIIETQKTLFYVLLGISLGLGLCSKYHIVLFPISILLSLLLSRQISLIQPKKLLLTMLFGLLFSLPVIIWNYNNDWASFAFQLNHGFNGRKFTVLWSITYVIGQVLIFNPFLFIQNIKSYKNNFVSKSALVQWGFFLVSSLRASVEANWPLTAHIQGLSGLQLNSSKLKKLGLFYSIGLWLFFIAVFYTDFGQSKYNKIPSSVIAEKIWNQVSGYSPLYGPTYQMSSLLELVSGVNVPKLPELSRYDFYDSGLFHKPTAKIYYALKYDISNWPEWLSQSNPKIELVQSFSDHSLALYRVSYE